MGFFFRPEKVSGAIATGAIAEDPRGPDYGVVNFVDLFANAVEGKEFDTMTGAEKTAFDKEVRALGQRPHAHLGPVPLPD